MTQIRTERLLLRPAKPYDLEAFHTILSDARATAYWSTPPHTDIAETESWLAAMLAIDPAKGEDFAIELDGRVIGKVGLFEFPEIGFILHPDSWGMGYAGEALRPVLERAFAVHGLPFVEADVDPRNAPSLRLLQSMGFVETGRAESTWKVGDEWCDSVFLRLTNPNRDSQELPHCRQSGASLTHLTHSPGERNLRNPCAVDLGPIRHWERAARRLAAPVDVGQRIGRSAAHRARRAPSCPVSGSALRRHPPSPPRYVRTGRRVSRRSGTG